ncbi:MAG: FlgD immunoglobulin-like domain containing protein [bacterium]
MQVTGLPRPSFLLVLAAVGAGAVLHYRHRPAPAADGLWASPAPLAHTASVPFFVRASDLSFTLAEAQTVEVDVYDASGRRVRRFPASMFSPGDHAISWDRLDEHGREVAAGFYTARFDFGSTWSARRLLWIGGMP